MIPDATDIQILHALYRPLTADQLARHDEIDASHATIYRHLDRLQEAGYIAEANFQTRGACWIRTTDQWGVKFKKRNEARHHRREYLDDGDV